MENSKQPAFPNTDGKTFCNDGLTKRELISAMLLQGLLSNSTETDTTMTMEKLAKFAITQTDELLTQLKKE